MKGPRQDKWSIQYLLLKVGSVLIYLKRILYGSLNMSLTPHHLGMLSDDMVKPSIVCAYYGDAIFILAFQSIHTDYNFFTDPLSHLLLGAEYTHARLRLSIP